MNKQILKEMYIEYQTPCDRLVSNPETLTNFTVDYVRRSGQQTKPALLGHTLLNMRRLGEDKGGLPRLKRKYWGRGNK